MVKRFKRIEEFYNKGYNMSYENYIFFVINKYPYTPRCKRGGGKKLIENMETLQDVLERSRVIDEGEYWKPLNEYYNPLLGLNNDKAINNEYKKWGNESFKKCFKEKWGIEDIYNDNNFHLILVIENESITQVSFTGCLYSWFGHFTMYKGCNNLRLYIKDLTDEDITYDNYRQYKKIYIEKFIKRTTENNLII